MRYLEANSYLLEIYDTARFDLTWFSQNSLLCLNAKLYVYIYEVINFPFSKEVFNRGLCAPFCVLMGVFDDIPTCSWVISTRASDTSFHTVNK